MSRRDGRESYSKRLHSRFEREPSPKKSRRDGKQATEKTYSSSHRWDVDTLDRDQKLHKKLQDALPLEVPPPTETKVQPKAIKESLDQKVDGLPDGVKHFSDPTGIPRSQTCIQHDERDSAGHGGRSSGRRAKDHGRWSEPKEQSSNRIRDKSTPKEPRADENSWRHDGFFELEKTEAPPSRKRPAFREKKIEAPAETDATANSSRKEGRGHNSQELERKLDRPVSRADGRNFKRRDEYFERGEIQRRSYQSRERLNEGGIRGRERFNGRYGESKTSRSGGFQAEKWKHDLFDDANKSPPPKKEEEQIAKVEALLAQ